MLNPTLLIAPTRIGDAVLASSILAHIAATDPAAQVTIATSPLAAPLFEGFPQPARILPITKRSYNRHWLKLWQQTVGTHWHAVWDVRNSILSYSLRMRHRHCFRPPHIAAPKVRQYEAAFGIAPLPAPRLWLRESDLAAARALLPDNHRYIIFAPIANWAPKEWPLAHYITLATSLLSQEYAGYRPVIICAGHEREKALPMLDALRSFSPVDLTHGSEHLLTIYAAMQRAEGFVGNDSGLMHMATAAATRTLGLFGPTPNIGDDYPHTHYLYAAQGDLNNLSPEQVRAAFLNLTRG